MLFIIAGILMMLGLVYLILLITIGDAWEALVGLLMVMFVMGVLLIAAALIRIGAASL